MNGPACAVYQVPQGKRVPSSALKMTTVMSSQNSTLPAGNGAAPRPNLLDQLPTEMLLKIMSQVTDLVSLDSLIRASPTCYRVFDSYAVEITDAVLNCGGVRTGRYISTGYTCGHIRVLVCIIAHIRSSTFPIRSFDELDERVFAEALRFKSRVSPSMRGFAPEHLDPDTKPAVIRSILATARRLTWCALDCLEFYLARFRTLEPEELPRRKYQEEEEMMRNGEGGAVWAASNRRFEIQPWMRIPPDVRGKPCQRRDVGPPSWAEEQRVTRTFWRLQLLVDLRQAARHQRLGEGWPEEDVKRIATRLVPEWEYGIFKHLEYHGQPIHLTPPEHWEIWAAMNYVRERHGVEEPGWWPPAAALRDVEVRRRWPVPEFPGGRAWKDLHHSSLAIAFLIEVFRSTSDMCTPLTRLRLSRIHHQYGVAFWSRERIIAYGLPLRLWYGSGRNRLYPPTVQTWYPWQSILSPEEKEIIAKAYREDTLKLIREPNSKE